MINNRELPIGFTMTLAQHSNALVRFSQMPQTKQQEIIEGARHITSSADMRNYVENI